jgi:transcriptional regulator with XRE-family HTH domain
VKKSLPIFAERLRTFRENRNLTKNALAVQAGVDPAFLGHLENGVKTPGWETICKLADALGVKTDAFR